MLSRLMLWTISNFKILTNVNSNILNVDIDRNRFKNSYVLGSAIYHFQNSVNISKSQNLNLLCFNFEISQYKNVSTPPFWISLYWTENVPAEFQLGRTDGLQNFSEEIWKKVVLSIVYWDIMRKVMLCVSSMIHDPQGTSPTVRAKQSIFSSNYAGIFSSNLRNINLKTSEYHANISKQVKVWSNHKILYIKIVLPGFRAKWKLLNPDLTMKPFQFIE